MPSSAMALPSLRVHKRGLNDEPEGFRKFGTCWHEMSLVQFTVQRKFQTGATLGHRRP